MSDETGTERSIYDEPTLEGREVAFADPAAVREAVEDAFDYRGDITLSMTGGETIEGFIFDRHFDGDDAGAWTVRLLLKGSDEKHVVRVAEIDRLTFSGKDTARGKSFERWMEKYRRSKLAERAAADADKTSS